MIRGLAVSAVALALLRGPGCGEVESADSAENAPCTRDKDCGHHLVCRQGVCTDGDDIIVSDASVDVRDAASDATDEDDGPVDATADGAD